MKIKGLRHPLVSEKIENVIYFDFAVANRQNRRYGVKTQHPNPTPQPAVVLTLEDFPPPSVELFERSQ